MSDQTAALIADMRRAHQRMLRTRVWLERLGVGVVIALVFGVYVWGLR